LASIKEVAVNTPNDTHSKTIGYVLWLFGFTGSHRFYYGSPVLGTIYFFTLGLLFIGWIIDLFPHSIAGPQGGLCGSKRAGSIIPLLGFY
jgi:TM2 domain-containing membrane protein YozV